MFKGVDHIGVGVEDVAVAKRFYGDLGFTSVVFEYRGELPGLERLTGRSRTEAEVVMLRTEQPGPLGLGLIKLVRLLDVDPPPMPEGLAWGEIGVCEVCVHARGQDAVFRHLVGEKGYPPLMEPVVAPLPPYDTTAELSYVADPSGGKVELLEWSDLCKGWPNGQPRVEGVNHVAFGVADMERSREFYGRLGFTELLFDFDGYFEPMASWYPGEPPKQRIVMLTNPYGAGVEPVQHFPPSKDRRGEWGHLGPMDFAVGVTNLDKAYRSLRMEGVEFVSEPQTVDVGTGEWRYAHVLDPDGIYVSLVEARY